MKKKTTGVCSRVGGIALVMLLVITVLTGCSTNEQEQLTMLKSENQALKERIESLEDSLETLQQHQSLLGAAVNVVTLLASQDFKSLSTHVHPTQGVRFSPYAYVEVESHLKFSAENIVEITQDKTVYTWGAYDGSGHPIELNFMDYYNRFVYDEEFVNPHLVGINRSISLGNTLVNIASVYPNGSFIEFHFTGFDPQYEGLDWRSLYLIFEELDGKWFLVGIAHDEWTI